MKLLRPIKLLILSDNGSEDAFQDRHIDLKKVHLTLSTKSYPKIPYSNKLNKVLITACLTSLASTSPSYANTADVPYAVCQATPDFSGIAPDGVEDLKFPRGYWAASYYEGIDGIVGYSQYSNDRNGAGGNGTKQFRGEAFWGSGENPVQSASIGTITGYGAWHQTETPTSTSLPHPSYQGATWTSGGNPFYQTDFRRTIEFGGTISIGGIPGAFADDSVQIFVNGTRAYAAFPGTSPDPKPSATEKGEVVVSAGDEVIVRYINLGWVGGYDFSFDETGVDCSIMSADLGVTKSSTPTEIVPGDGLVYTIVATNEGLVAVTDAEISDTVTAPLQNCTYTAMASAGSPTGFTASGSGSIADTAVNLDMGDEITYTMTCEIDPTTANTTLSNTVNISSAAVSDPFASNNSATETDTILARAPVADDDTGANPIIGTPTTIDILDGDTDADGDTTIDVSSVSIVSNNATDTDGDGDNDQLIVAGEGTWNVDDATGEMTFTPEVGFMGDPTPLQYTVDDITGLTSNPASVSVDYPDAPIVDNDGAANPTVGTPTVVDVLANDGDPSGIPLDPATVQIAGTSAPGEDLVVVGEGTWSVNPSTGEITFTPEAGFIGDPTVIRYTVDDVNGNTSPTATVTVTYGEPPTAVDDNASNPVVGSPTVIQVVSNDSDLEDTTVDPTTVLIVDPANPGTPVTTLTVPGEGEWTVDPATGDITFTPEAGFTGDPTPIQYTVDDSDGNTSNPAAVNVAYGDLPVASPDGAVNMTAGAPTTIDVFANDNDPDGNIDPTTVMILDAVGNPVTSLVVPGEGTWTVDASGAITFTPDPSFTGDPTVISYTVEDNDGNTSLPATVTVTYDIHPGATDDTVVNPTIGSDTVINVIGNDNDPDGSLNPESVMIIDPVSGDPVTSLTVAGEGVWTVDPVSGVITFSPATGFTGDPTPIMYTVEDNDKNTSNPATVTVTYGEAPVATDDIETNLVIGTPTVVDLVSNDGDSDGNIDLKSVQIVGSTDPNELIVIGEGVWTVNPGTGTITFTPEAGFTGDPAPIQYTVDDNSGNPSEPATVTVDYPDAPVVDNDGEANPIVGTPTVVDVLANDGDPSGIPLDPATVQIAGTDNPGEDLVVIGQGTWSVNPTTGEITFTPETDFIGDPTVISYTVDDINGNTSDLATVTVMYGEPPIAVADNASNPVVGTPTVVQVISNDSDIEDTTVDATTVLIVDPANPGTPVTTLTVTGEGEWTVNPTTGDITFTPETGFTGDPTPIQYTVDDSDGNTSNPAAVNVDYGEIPVASPDGAVNTMVGTPTTVNVFANDNDPDGNIVAASVMILDPSGNPVTTLVVPGEGTWTVEPSGAITFTPDTGFTGDPSVISYTVNDNDGNTSLPATLTVTYDEDPAATDDTVVNPTLGSDTVVDILGNDEDPNGTLIPATVQIAGTANPGDPLTVVGEGVWTINPLTGAITFSPETGFTGDPAPITYIVSDDDGNVSNPATVSVTYGEAPVATDDTQLNPTIGTPTVVSLIGNDSDSDGNLDLNSVQIVGTANPGDPLTVTGGEWTVNPGTGTITFTPNPGFTGDPDPIAYTISDNSGNVSNEANVTVTYGDAPIAVNNSIENPTIGAPTTITLVGNTDADGTVESVQLVGADASGEVVVAGQGTWSVNTDGTVTFTPLPGYVAEPTPIPYTVTDNSGNVSNVANITVTYGQPPVAINDVASSSLSVSAGENVIINVIDMSDSDPDSLIDPATVDLDPSTPGIDSTFTNIDGTYTVDALGVVTFDPVAGLTTDPTPIEYTVNDIFGNTSNLATINITYGDEPPILENDGEANPTLGTPTEVDVLANDSDPDGGALDITSVQIAGTSAAGEDLVVDGQGTWSVNPTTGAITFTPEDGYIGDPTVISYTIDDNDGNTSDPATVTVTYGEPPIAVADNASNLVVGTPTIVQVVSNDSDIEDTNVDPTTVLIIDPANPGSPVNTLTVADQGEWTVNPTTGDITFTPLPTFKGDPTPIQYTVDDSDGNTSNPAAVNVDYGDLPIANPDGAANPLVGSPTTIDVFANDNDPDGNIVPTTVMIIDPSGNPVTSLVVTGGTWTVEPSGAITFTPDLGFSGDPAVISYTVDDSDGNTSEPATVTVTYGDAPEATDDILFNPTLGSDSIVDILSNDNDPDGSLVPATVQIVGTTNPGDPLVIPNVGTWTVDLTSGAITFVPVGGYTGDPAPITYTVDDNAGNTSNPATVTVTYGEAPIATDDSQLNSTIGTPTVISLIGNDGDTDGNLDLDTVTLVGETAPGELTIPNQGVWTVNAGTGTITFTPDADFTGDPDPIAYTISDNSGNVSNEASVAVTYGDAPIAVDNTIVNPIIGSPTTITLVGNTDADGTIDSVQLVGANASGEVVVAGQGTWSVNPDGTVTFIPLPGYTRNPTPIAYTVTDNSGNVSSPANVSFTYGQPPVAIDDMATVNVSASSDGLVTIDVISGSDSDPDNAIDPASVDLDPTTPGIDNIFTNADGTYTVDAAGVVTFTPIAGLLTSPEPIAYTVRDTFGNVSNPALITINLQFAPENIPTLSEWMLILLTMLLLLAGFKENSRKSKQEGTEF